VLPWLLARFIYCYISTSIIASHGNTQNVSFLPPQTVCLAESQTDRLQTTHCATLLTSNSMTSPVSQESQFSTNPNWSTSSSSEVTPPQTCKSHRLKPSLEPPPWALHQSNTNSDGTELTPSYCNNRAVHSKCDQTII
jgi:hypothetical protein